MSSSIPCQTAYQLAIATLTVGSVAAVAAVTAFILYAVELHYRPNRRFVASKYDIESASWLMMLASIASLATCSPVIANYLCGSTCPSTTINCNTQTGQYAATLSGLGAACMKIASFYHQRYVSKQENPEGPDWVQILSDNLTEQIRKEFNLQASMNNPGGSSSTDTSTSKLARRWN
jgi:hypothetical protein